MFEAKASRHRRAMAGAPFARIMEVLPFYGTYSAYFLSKKRCAQKFVDIFAGSGYLAHYLAPLANETLAIDGSANMLLPLMYNDVKHLIMDAIIMHPTNKDLSQFDGIFSLAGIHHIYKTINDTIDLDNSIYLQQRVLKNWAKRLRKGGLFLVADIPSEKISPTEYKTTRSSDLTKWKLDFSHLKEHFPEILKFLQEFFPSHIIKEMLGKNNSDISSYMNFLCNILPKEVIEFENPVPSNWFLKHVKYHSLFGHKECFLHPHILEASLKEAGFNVLHCIIPTPLLFKSERELAWYFYEAFALGKDTHEIKHMDSQREYETLRAIRRFLTINRLNGGKCCLSWNNVFLMAYHE